MPAPDRSSKKTEAIELRVSPEEKAALKTRAAAEGVTVSALIRSLVAAYLATPAPAAAPAPQPWRRLMTLTLTSPAGRFGLVAGACALAFGWLGLSGPSSAQDVAVDLFASVTQGVDQEAVRHTATAELAMDYGAATVIPIGSDEPGPDPRFVIVVQVAPGAEDQAVITTRLLQIAPDGTETEMAAPRLVAAFGETAAFQVNSPDFGALEVRMAVTPEG